MPRRPSKRSIPVQLVLTYLRACEPLLGRVSDRVRPRDPLSNAVMPLFGAFRTLQHQLRRYARSGSWNGVPPYLAREAVGSNPKGMQSLVLLKGPTNDLPKGA